MPGDRSAPDVAQQANAKIWEKRSEFELGTNFKAWAFAIARYEVLNYRKQQLRDSRMHFSSELETQLSEDMEVREDSLEMRQEALSKCLEMLDERHRELLMHRYASTATLGEVASQTNRSVGSLKVTLHRLRSKLLSCINRRMAGGEA
jgi:RNA polymerase sigma-70 factor (ECF subfamily)